MNRKQIALLVVAGVLYVPLVLIVWQVDSWLAVGAYTIGWILCEICVYSLVQDNMPVLNEMFSLFWPILPIVLVFLCVVLVVIFVFSGIAEWIRS